MLPTLPAAFDCVVERDADRVQLAPVGELDMAAAPGFRETIGELRAAGFDHVVLDLRSLSFIDSSGLHAILALDAEARADSLMLELIPGPPAVQRIFELTDTLRRLPFRDSG